MCVYSPQLLDIVRIVCYFFLGKERCGFTVQFLGIVRSLLSSAAFLVKLDVCDIQCISRVPKSMLVYSADVYCEMSGFTVQPSGDGARVVDLQCRGVGLQCRGERFSAAFLEEQEVCVYSIKVWVYSAAFWVEREVWVYSAEVGLQCSFLGRIRVVCYSAVE
jgi:hypothetical protein